MPPRTLVLLVALTALCSSRVSAEMPSMEEQARLLREQGMGALEAGAPADARALFERSLALVQDARTRMALGHALYEMGAPVDAFLALSEALDQETYPLTREDRVRAAAARDLAAARVGRIVVTTRPRDVALLIDGRSPRAYRGELVVEPGEHVVLASADGFLSEQRRIEVLSGRTVRVRLTLTRETREARALREAFVGPGMQGSELGESAGPGGLGLVGVGSAQAVGVGTIGSGPDGSSRTVQYAFEVGAVTAQGGMSSGDLRRALAGMPSAADRCGRLETTSTFRNGTVVVELAFARDGTPFSVRIRSGDLGHPALEACLRAHVSRLRFAPEPSRAPTQATVAFRVRRASR